MAPKMFQKSTKIDQRGAQGRFIHRSKLPTANVPLRALEGWGAREDLIPVGVRSALFGVVRFGWPTTRFSNDNFQTNTDFAENFRLKFKRLQKWREAGERVGKWVWWRARCPLQLRPGCPQRCQEQSWRKAKAAGQQKWEKVALWWAKASQKVAKGSQKETKGTQKEAKGRLKGAKGSQKEAKGSQKGAKWSQKGA